MSRPTSCFHISYPICGCKLDPSRPLTPNTPPPERPVRRQNDGKYRATPARIRSDGEEWGKTGIHDIPWIQERKEPVDPNALLDSIEQALTNPEAQAALNKQVDAALARASFAEFCRQAWPVIEPTTTLLWNWHHDLVCKILQGIYEDWEKGRKDRKFQQRVIRALFNLPPGSSKSRLISVFFMAWVWTRSPQAKFICLSVNEDAALRDARATRDVLRSEWYLDSFTPTWTIKGNQDAISNFGNTSGGERLSRASGSEIVGLRCDFLLCDDLNNPKETENRLERKHVNDLWDTNIRSRVNDVVKSVVIGVQQRTHAQDWSGHVLSSEGAWDPVTNPRGWLLVAIPGEYEPERKCVTPWGSDPRTIPGESIHPERFPIDWLAKEREQFREQFAGQWQQRPTPAGGGKVRSVWWGFARLSGGVRPDVDDVNLNRARPAECVPATGDGAVKALVVPPAVLRPGYWELDNITISVDPANQKTEDGSNWGILVVAKWGARWIVLEDASRLGDWNEILSEVLTPLIRFWKPDRLLVEAKAAGPSLLTGFRKALEDGDFAQEGVDFAAVAIETVSPDAAGDKIDRLEAVSTYIRNGLVLLREGADWLNAFVEEFGLFPNGERSDRVDALSQVLAHDMAEGNNLPDW